MSDELNINEAWDKLFSRYGILEEINTTGYYSISASQIREFKEPRLMAKFDHRVNLPKLFDDNQLAILPDTRSSYIISHFEAYHKIEKDSSSIERVSLPTYLQSLDSNNVPSEAIALNCAFASGMVAEFLEDDDLLPTVAGRMGSGIFGFNINNSKSEVPCHIDVSNSQIEIDAAYEGIRGLALIEAKRDLSEDFLIRQLYYPYRVWRNRVTKPVRPIFLVYSNSIYHLYEYRFEDPNNYNSLVIVKQKNYSVEDMSITIEDIQEILRSVNCVPEPNIPFPQADNFERVINLCELLNGQELSRNDVTEQYAFNERQTNYYTDAARYLGLVDKCSEDRSPIFSLSDEGKKVLNLNFKQRQLAFSRLVLSHEVFAKTLREYFGSGEMPSKDRIVQIMKTSQLYNVGSDDTFERRSSTIRGWLNWIVGLPNE